MCALRHGFSTVAKLKQVITIDSHYADNQAPWRRSRDGDSSLVIPCCVLLAKAQNVAVGILDIKIEACPWSFFPRLDPSRPTHFQLAKQAANVAYANIRIQMFVLFSVLSLPGRFRGTL